MKCSCNILSLFKMVRFLDHFQVIALIFSDLMSDFSRSSDFTVTLLALELTSYCI